MFKIVKKKVMKYNKDKINLILSLYFFRFHHLQSIYILKFLITT